MRSSPEPILLKSLRTQADDVDMTPLDSRPSGEALPPPVVHPTAVRSSVATPGPGAGSNDLSLLPMAPWRLTGALAMIAAFVTIGWQVQRLVVDQPWSEGVMWLSALAGAVTWTCVLAWTWTATENARRLVGPAVNRPLPDPHAAVLTWILPMAFVGLGVAVVAYLGDRVGRVDDDTVATIPLAVAVIALLLAIPLTYRPMHCLAGVVRQVGGHSAHLAQWMWVPVVLGVVGLATLAAIRFGVVDDANDGATVWGPMWAVAVVAVVPCAIVVLLAWRASGTVEEAITIAAARRQVPGAAPRRLPPPVAGQAVAGRRVGSPMPVRARVRLIPGAGPLRLMLVTLLAGLALLSLVGAAVMFMFWLEANDGGLTVGQRDRAWQALDALHSASRVLAFVLLGAVSLWTFVVVLNVRRASGRRRNPMLAALVWPAAGFGVWAIADRLIVDQSIGRVVVGFAAQAAVLAVPFLLLERSAETIGARRTPIRITYVLGVVLLVHIQGLGGLSTIEETTDISEFGRLTGYLALGALVQFMSLMALTDACRAITSATEHEVEHHNMLAAQSAARPNVAGPPATVAVAVAT